MEGHIFLKDLLFCTIELDVFNNSRTAYRVYLSFKQKPLALVSSMGAMIGAAAVLAQSLAP